MKPTDYLNHLNQTYLTVHRNKENFFWETYMGLSDDHAGSTAAEANWISYLSESSTIAEIEAQIELAQEIQDQQEKQQTMIGLKGWLAMFRANAMESDQAKQQKQGLIEFESTLFEKKQKYVMTYSDDKGESCEGSLPVLSSVIRSSAHQPSRQSAHAALLELEQWLLKNGFIELVKKRNAFARSLGHDNFFDYSILKTEHMTTETLFSILDEFEKQTADINQASLDNLKKEKGEQALAAYNFSYSFAGDVMRELDQYVPFSKSLKRWVESFGRLNIAYSGAELTLDLLDRKGKYPNGFCHGPIPSYYDQGKWVAAKVNFTSNAKPDQMGSGYDGINTLFHEGGHAAHFSNVKMNSPCFSMEFAPTSMAYAETQSMFCDSLLTDADWLKSYALDDQGEAVPDSVIQSMINSKQPFKAYGERSILVVPYFERALYALTGDELTPERITELARSTEKRILGLECSPRPMLAIPHLLSDESACSYQGYLLAHMAVYQTRSYFMEKFGYLTDNPEIGPLLAEHYWNKGNSVNHNDGIKSLTSEGFNPKYLADSCNLTAQQAWQEQQKKIASLAERKVADVQSLNASIKIVDGPTVIASNDVSDEQMCQDFQDYIVAQYGR